MIIQNIKIKTLLLTAVLALLTVGGASATIPYGTLLKHVDQFPLVPVTLNNDTVINQMAWGDSYGEGLHPEYLIDENVNTHWDSNWHTDEKVEQPGNPYDYYGGRHYIEVNKFRDIDGSVTRGDAGDILLISMKTRVSFPNGSPKSMDIYYHNPDNGKWTLAGTINMTFKEGKADNDWCFSNCLIMLGNYDALRLVNNSIYPDGGLPKYHIKLAELQITKVDRIVTDFNIYKAGCNPSTIPELIGSGGLPFGINYEFVHTKSVTDPHNQHVIGDYNEMPAWYSDWAGAAENNWKNADILEQNGIVMPDYRYIKVNGGDRQPTHTMEHTVYAMPGEPLVLYPCSDFHVTTAYYINFVRWYDWNTDKHSPNLFFPYQPERMYNLESGVYNGSILYDGDNDLRNTEGNSLGNTPVFWTGGANFDEITVACDLTIQGGVTREDNFKDSEKKLYEPVVALRHIFHVRNALEMAKTISENEEANRKYIESTKRVVSARSGTDFQIRLSHPLPLGSCRNNENYDVFYLDEAGNVQRGYAPVIEIDGVRYADNSGVFCGYSGYSGPGGTYYNPGDGKFYQIGHEGDEFYRFLFCSAGNATSGTHKIRLLLTDKNGNVVNVRGTGSPIVVEQFDVTFLPAEAAILITEETLLKNSEKYEYTTPKYMEERLKLGKPVAVVDFDEYRHLVDYPDYVRTYDKNDGKYMYKWPRPWKQSNYCFGYDHRNDYNMYMLASRSDLTPYYGTTGNDYNQSRNAQCTFNPDPNHLAHTSNMLYDRLFYESKGAEHGFFYYVNAAVDPGQLATMKIGGLCSGSTLFVSGWMAEGSGGETENLIVNFNAVMKDTGETVRLHSFVTGYIPGNVTIPETETVIERNLGVWNYFYYSFVPNFAAMGIDEKLVDHYELFVENNCKNSGGADYFFDDIRVYVAKPQVFASQITAICQGGECTDVRVSTPYEVILSSMGEVEPKNEAEGKDMFFYYTFLKKSVYDKAIANGEGTDAAFDKAVVRYNYDGGDNKNQIYGIAAFNTFYEKNRPLDRNFTAVDGIISRAERNGVRTLFFNTRPTDESLNVGDEYYMSIVSGTNRNEVLTSENFDILGSCAKTCSFLIQASSTIKIDGVAVPDLSNIQICDNQWPVVQLDIFSQKPQEDPDSHAPGSTLEEESAVIDWFDGSIAQFKDAKYNGTPLMEALLAFRRVRDYRELDDPDQEPKEGYTSAHRETLIHFFTVFDPKTQRRPPLLLHRNSYIFPYIDVPDGQPSMEIYATAIPIDRYDEVTDAVICTSPSEIRVNVAQKSPFLKHGINSDDLTYPELMDDVPLRITLNELHRVSGDIESNDAEYIAKAPALVVPIRQTKAVTPGVIKFLMKGEDDYVYLVGTNDPAYKDLGLTGDKDPDNPNSNNTKGLRPIGRFRELTAIVDGDKSLNNARLQFRYDDQFRFREGYWYKIRFNYQEDKENSSNTVCDGQDVLTIKVVPEYAIFTNATGNNNFNNDDNWRRVTSTELLGSVSGDREYVSDGDNANTFSYAPVHTTQIILPVSADKHPLVLNNTTPVPVTYKDVITQADHTEQWIRDPDGEKTETITEEIYYDMVAESHASQEKPSVVCRPWRANTCEDVHLNSGATVFNHPALNYGTASVDFETKPGMWYSLSSPLQSVYAGDMYLPTNGARQETRLFRDINFEYGTHNRFAPAVYQRSWNTGQATVYELPGEGTQRNVAVKSTWSNVYNDVQVNYGGGHGFSIKTDVSRAQNPKERVKFRLPKADEKYKYYSMDGTVSGNEQSVARTNTGRLFDGEVTATLTGAVLGKYFMAGNPYLRYLSPKAFLDANPQLERKIYIMNSEGHLDMVVAADGTVTSAGTLPNNGLIAPMQGFFVVAKDNKLSQDVTFSLDMAADDPVADNSTTPLNAPRKARAESTADFGGITVTASAEGQDLSSAVIRLDGAATEKFDANEDVTLFIDGLSDNPRVYTVADGVATTINTLPVIERVEVGLVNEDRPVTLTFTGVEGAGSGYVLYDAETGDVTPLTEGLSVNVRGMASQRFFITAAADDIETIPAIGISVSGREVTVTATAAEDALDVMVFDSVGRSILSMTDPSGEAVFSLTPGVYVIKAATGPRNLIRKVIIK